MIEIPFPKYLEITSLSRSSVERKMAAGTIKHRKDPETGKIYIQLDISPHDITGFNLDEHIETSEPQTDHPEKQQHEMIELKDLFSRFMGEYKSIVQRLEEKNEQLILNMEEKNKQLLSAMEEKNQLLLTAKDEQIKKQMEEIEKLRSRKGFLAKLFGD